MRFLVDECTGPAVARWLEQQGHDVFSIYDQVPGLADDDVLRRALANILADYEDLEHDDILAALAFATRLTQVKRVQSVAV